MILSAIFDMVFGLVKVLFGWINLPQTPEKVASALDYLCECIGDGIGFIGLVIDLDFIKVVIPIVLVISNFDKVYHFTVWILRKIPFLGIK